MSIVWYKVLPAHFGGQKGIANFNEALAKHCTLLCVCSKNNEPGSAAHYQVFNWLPVSKLQVINPLVWFKLLAFAIKHKITHVVLENPYHAVAATLLRWTGRTIICHSHNIEYNRWKLQGKRHSQLIKLIERYVYKTSKLVLFKTQADIEFAVDTYKLDVNKTMLMPYCIEPAVTINTSKAKAIVFERHNIPAGNKLLLFNGTLDYAPNAEAVVNIKKHLVHALRKLRLPFTIIITGRLHDPSFEYLNHVRAREVIMAGEVEDIGTYFGAADVYINAVSEGAGIQTKTLEALSHQLPVVMFNHMTNGIETQLVAQHLSVVAKHDWPAFAACVQSFVNKARRPVSNEFFKHYSFDRHLPQFVEFINNES